MVERSSDMHSAGTMNLVTLEGSRRPSRVCGASGKPHDGPSGTIPRVWMSVWRSGPCLWITGSIHAQASTAPTERGFSTAGSTPCAHVVHRLVHSAASSRGNRVSDGGSEGRLERRGRRRGDRSRPGHGAQAVARRRRVPVTGHCGQPSDFCGQPGAVHGGEGPVDTRIFRAPGAPAPSSRHGPRACVPGPLSPADRGSRRWPCRGRRRSPRDRGSS